MFVSQKIYHPVHLLSFVSANKSLHAPTQARSMFHPPEPTPPSTMSVWLRAQIPGGCSAVLTSHRSASMPSIWGVPSTPKKIHPHWCHPTFENAHSMNGSMYQKRWWIDTLPFALAGGSKVGSLSSADET